MGGKVRSFLAIELSEGLKQALAALQKQLDLPQYDVRWVSARNVHLTLRFLGEITDEGVEKASQAATAATEKGSPFPILLRGTGAFPSLRSPRVVWVGIDLSEPLLQLEKALSRELKKAHFQSPDKPFRPHLTLGRVKSQRGKGDLRMQLEKNQGITLGRMDVDHFALIKSDLRPSGPVYTPLVQFFLTESGTGSADGAFS